MEAANYANTTMKFSVDNVSLIKETASYRCLFSNSRYVHPHTQNGKLPIVKETNYVSLLLDKIFALCECKL